MSDQSWATHPCGPVSSVTCLHRTMHLERRSPYAYASLKLSSNHNHSPPYQLDQTKPVVYRRSAYQSSFVYSYCPVEKIRRGLISDLWSFKIRVCFGSPVDCQLASTFQLRILHKRLVLPLNYETSGLAQTGKFVFSLLVCSCCQAY